MHDTGKAQVRADKDKNCPGNVHIIVGGPSASNYSAHSPSASSSKRCKGMEVYQVEQKRLKVDNTITFTDEDFERV